MGKVTAILVADLHIRDDVPECRTDDFLMAQSNKMEFLSYMKKECDCPVLMAGDLFHKPRVSQYTEALAIRQLPGMYGVPGQHDLPSHNLDNIFKSSIGVLSAANKIRLLLDDPLVIDYTFIVKGFPFGVPFSSLKTDYKGRKVAVIHKMIHKDQAIHSSIESTAGIYLLKKSNYDLIVSGDNHLPFVVEYEGRILVNCGSMMRTTADQIDYVPGLWLWYSEENTVERVDFPHEKGVVSRTHLERKEIKDQRMESFVKSVSKSYEIGLSFQDNLEHFFGENKTRQGIKDKIYEAMEVK